MTTVCLILALAGCGGDELPMSPEGGPPQNQLVATVEIHPPVLTVPPDETESLEAIVKSARGQTVNGRTVTWKSSDSDIVAVDADGNITAVNEGTAEVKADVQGRVGTATIQVRGEVIAVELNTAELSTVEGAEAQLEATYVFRNGARRPARKVSWSSADPDVATVDSDGLVVGQKEGETRIDAESRGRKTWASVFIDAAAIGGIRVFASRRHLAPGDTARFWAEVQTRNGVRLHHVPVNWRTDDVAVATVTEKGLVRAVAPGQTSVVAATHGQTASANLSVTHDADDETRPGRVSDLAVTRTEAYSATLRFTEVEDGEGGTPDYLVRAGEPPFDWSRAEDVRKGSCAAPVAGSGAGRSLTCTVEGLQPGTDYVFQVAAFRGELDGEPVFGDLSNAVEAETDDVPVRVEISPPGLVINVGEERQLEASVTDDFGNPLSGTTVTWKSSNVSVATVTSEGVVEGLAAGSASIQASTDGASASVQVTVNAAPSRTGGGSSDPTGGSAPPSGSSSNVFAAFPGAEGWGAQALTRCNRSQVQVLRVTNLNDSGSGSLRDAIARVRNDVLSVIVFDVAGLIRLGDRIDIEKSCLYIAGQTAPGGGITIANSGSQSFYLRGQVDNVAIRYLRFRGGYRGDLYGNLNILVGSGHDIILDHLSLSWTADKLIAITKFDGPHSTPVHNVTLQRSIMSEIFAWHPTASSISGEPRNDPPIWNIDVHHNLYAHNSHRNPLVSTRGARIANNVVYNWLQGASHGESRSVADFIGNYYKPGPMTHPDLRWEVTYLCEGGVPGAGPDFYVSGNVGPHNSDPGAGPGSQWEGDQRVVACYNDRAGTPITRFWPRVRRDSPMPAAPIPVRTESATAAYSSVLADVGANARVTCDGVWQANTDRVDSRVISEARNGGGIGSRLTHESGVGGYPSIAGGSGCGDSDGDGMPDAFESRYGFDPSSGSDGARDADGDGYSNVEEYLNGTRP